MPWLIVRTNGHQLQPLSSPLTQNLFYSFQQMDLFEKKKSNWLIQSRDMKYILGAGSIISLPTSHFQQRFYPKTEISSWGMSVNSFLNSFSYHFVTGIGSSITVWFYQMNIMHLTVFSNSIVLPCCLRNF